VNVLPVSIPHLIRTIMLPLAFWGSVLGCSGLSEELQQEIKRVPTDFLLGPEDVLDVVVWRNQDLSRTVVVRPDGYITMPLIGDVQASGFTANQLADRIANRIKEFKENPSVSVTVKEVNSYFIYVLGEVAKPGKYSLKAYTTVLQAIALVGGFTPFASTSKMHVLRISTNGLGPSHQVKIPVPYEELVSGNGSSGNFYLQSGDVIVVP
jgi:polysaccharide export outer membrane protein